MLHCALYVLGLLTLVAGGVYFFTVRRSANQDTHQYLLEINDIEQQIIV